MPCLGSLTISYENHLQGYTNIIYFESILDKLHLIGKSEDALPSLFTEALYQVN